MLRPSDHGERRARRGLNGRFASYQQAMDRQLPGVLTGLYVVGSVALGDYSPRFSDIDVVSVSERQWTPTELDIAVRSHVVLCRRRHPARVAYVTFAELQSDPRSLEAPCFEGPHRMASHELVNAFTWQILDGCAVALRGPSHPPVWVDQSALREWADHELHDRWRPWLDHIRHRPGWLWFRPSLAADVLEVCRLHEVAMTGQICSKLDAADAISGELSRRRVRIVHDAAGLRRGYHTSLYWGPVERKHDAIDLIDEVTATSGDGPTPTDDR